MFDAAIRNARRVVAQTFRSIELSPPPAAIQEATLPHLDRALGQLAYWMGHALRREAPGGWLAVWESSNFMERAALDLLGPCMCAALLQHFGEWDPPTTQSSFVKSFKSLFSVQPETRSERVAKLIQHVIDSHLGFALSMTGRILHDANLLRQAYNFTHSVQSIFISSSDPHQCAQRVAIVTSSGGVKVVYKPSDLTFQMLLMGDENSFRLTRPQLPGLGTHTASLFGLLGVELPVLRIIPGGRKDDGHYGYMEFKQRARRLAPARIQGFFHQFGRLVGVACMFGLTDLHQENCMATAEGPYLIDAEMSFSYPSRTTNKVTHSTIDNALKPPAEAPSPSVVGGTFIAYQERGRPIQADAVKQERSADDDNSYISSTAGGGLLSGRNYLQNLQEGLGEAVDAVAEHADAVRAWLRLFDVLRPLARVPLSTSLMSAFYTGGIQHYLAGTLPPGHNLPGLGFADWFIRYGGVSNSLPAAYVTPHSTVSLQDPSGALGITVASCGNEIDVSSTLAVRVHVTAMKNRMAAAQEKHTLKRNLEQALA